MNYLKEFSRDLNYKRHFGIPLNNKAIVYNGPSTKNSNWTKILYRCLNCGAVCNFFWLKPNIDMEDYLRSIKVIERISHHRCEPYFNLKFRIVSKERFLSHCRRSKKLMESITIKSLEETFENELFKRV